MTSEIDEPGQYRSVSRWTPNSEAITNVTIGTLTGPPA